MGCASSKLDDLPAVALCRDRSTFLNEAINQRFLLAQAHLAYVHSLRGIASSLHLFMEQDFAAGGSGGVQSDAPKLNLPPKGKGVVEDVVNSPKKKGGGGGQVAHGHSRSHSGSHLHFVGDSDDDDDDDGSHLHDSDHSSPIHSHGGGGGGGYMSSEYVPMAVDQSSFPAGGYPGGGFGFPGGGGGYPEGGGGYPGGGGGYPGGGGGYPGGGGGGYPGGGGGYPGGGGGYPGGEGGGGGIFHMNYMKKRPTASVVYQQRPGASEAVQFGEASSSSSSSAYYYNQPSNSNNPYPVGNSSSYSNFGYGGGGGLGGGGGYGPPPTYGGSSSLPPPPQQAAASSSKPPPAPPSPPRASAWDFLNPFESYDSFYPSNPSNPPSRDSRDVREEEGIPDLEDEVLQHEVVKEVHGDPKYVAEDSDDHHGYSKSVMMDDEEEVKGGKVGEAEASLYQTRPSVSMETDGPEYEVHVVEKKVVDKDKSPDERGNGGGGGFKGRGGGAGWRDVSQVAVEIKIQFERASDYGNEIAKMLEVGKLPYHRKHVSKKLQSVTTPLSLMSTPPSALSSLEASSSNDGAGPAYLEMEEELAVRSKNLSSTLHKLHLWEKKLYTEVKAEEKMRVIHDRKCRKLKRLDERGAEAHKIDETRKLIRDLSTKIKIAIQVVDKISVTINKIRDEELWPQLNDLILGLSRMWKNMLECHGIQCQAIKEAKGLGPMGSGKKLSDDHLQATLQLEQQLLNWTSSFSSWVGAQKGYVKALNNWLVKCLLYEPEETPDGVAPFSPGRMGAPPVFVICNQWAQAIDRISEKEVVDSMRVFAYSVFKLWEQDKEEIRSRMVTNKDLERKVKNLDREDQKIQKQIQALDKKMVLVSGDGDGLSLTGNIVYHSDTSNGSLQGSLQRIFETMERFTADSVKAYEDLVQRSEEETRGADHGEAS